ncbi:hypothetical protein MASR2M47_16960 [Draconibacterium sp.]
MNNVRTILIEKLQREKPISTRILISVHKTFTAILQGVLIVFFGYIVEQTKIKSHICLLQKIIFFNINLNFRDHEIKTFTFSVNAFGRLFICPGSLQILGNYRGKDECPIRQLH